MTGAIKQEVALFHCFFHLPATKHHAIVSCTSHLAAALHTGQQLFQRLIFKFILHKYFSPIAPNVGCGLYFLPYPHYIREPEADMPVTFHIYNNIIRRLFVLFCKQWKEISLLPVDFRSNSFRELEADMPVTFHIYNNKIRSIFI